MRGAQTLTLEIKYVGVARTTVAAHFADVISGYTHCTCIGVVVPVCALLALAP
jgi:hypothetical protein